MTRVEPGVFLSDESVYAYEGTGMDARVIGAFAPSPVFIDPKELEAKYKVNRKQYTAIAFIVHRFKPNGGQWTGLTDAPQPSPIAYDTAAELYCVIRVKNPNGQTEYFLGNPGDNLPTSANVGGGDQQLIRWPAQYPALAFSWRAITPKYKDYSNKKTGAPFVFDKHDYTESEVSQNRWIYQLDGNQVGISRWTVEVTIETHPFGPPGKDAREETPGDQRIANKVKRILRMGNYPNDYLKWASTYLNVAWTFGANPGQYDNYVGTDCAKLCCAAYRKIVPNTPEASANTLVGNARTGTNPYIGVVGALDNKKLADNVPRNQLSPGDLIVLRKAAEGAMFHHAVIYIGEKRDGTLDGSEKIIMANWARGQTNHYRVTIIDLSSVLGAVGGAAPYDTFVVLRWKFPP